MLGVKIGVFEDGQHNLTIPRCVARIFDVYAHEIHVYTRETHVQGMTFFFRHHQTNDYGF